MLFISDAGAVMVMLTFTPVPLCVTSAKRCLPVGEGEVEATNGAAAAELSAGVTLTVTDTPGGKPSAGAAASAPGEACTTATMPCKMQHLMSHCNMILRTYHHVDCSRKLNMSCCSQHGEESLLSKPKAQQKDKSASLMKEQYMRQKQQHQEHIPMHIHCRLMHDF